MKSPLKHFLLYFSVCFAPLLLLASLNYWNGVRTVDATIGANLQRELEAITSEVDRRLQDEEYDLRRVALSNPLKQLVAEGKAPASLPADLELTVASIFSARGGMSSLTLYGRDHELLFSIRRNTSESDGVSFRVSDVAPRKLTPHDVLLMRQTQITLDGSLVQYIVPVVDETKAVAPALLVGELKLDEVVADATRVLETTVDRGALPQSFVTVLSKSGTLIYHSDHSLRGQQANSAMPTFVPVAAEAITNTGGMGSFRTLQGQDYLVAFAPLPRLNVAVAVARDRSQFVSTARRWGLIGFASAVVLGLLAATLFGRYVQKRTRGIERVTEDLTAIAKGELDRRIELKSSDDARGIADNINVVTERLRAQIAREAETRQFQSFVRVSAMLTHDLKNAIEVLSLTVGNMERHYDNPQFRLDAMKSLAGATDKLKAIVARLSKPLTSLSGEHKRPANVDLVPILERVVAMTADPLRDKHNIEMKLPPSLLALVDAGRIAEVIENLVLNALEAMAEKSGTLTVAAGTLPNGAAMFSVSDTGPGMSRVFIDKRLFRPFSTTKKNGIGLGLYACREIIEASAGRIEVQSVEGAGTTFRVVLPSPANDGRT